MKVTTEGGGHVATCDCGWLRWDLERPVLRKYAEAHVKGCKKVGAK